MKKLFKYPLKRFWTMRRKENMAGYIFTLPWVLGFLLFFLYPLCYSIVIAFSAIEDLTSFKLRFVFLDNFSTALVHDVYFVPYLLQSIKDTLVNTPVVVLFALFIAILLNRNVKFRGFYRVAFLLPVLIGTGAVMQALQGNSSYVGTGLGTSLTQGSAAAQTGSFKDIVINNQITSLLGGPAAGYLTGILKMVSSIIWMSGIQIIIFLGALQGIPSQLYEAAECDGATEWEKFWKITLPLTMPVIQINVVYTMIDYFTNINNKVITYVTTISFSNFMLSYGSAMSWMYFLVVGIMMGLVFAIMKRYTFYMR